LHFFLVKDPLRHQLGCILSHHESLLLDFATNIEHGKQNVAVEIVEHHVEMLGRDSPVVAEARVSTDVLSYII